MNARASMLIVVALLTISDDAFATPSGNRWALSACGTCPMGQQCVGAVCIPQYRIAASVNNTGGMSINGPTGGVPYGNFATIVQQAFAAWTSTRVSCNTNWNSVQGASFSSPSTHMDAIDGMDRNNNIIFFSGAEWPHLSNELALTVVTYFTSNREIFDGDMDFNNNLAWSENTTVGTYDLFSVAVHEAGHFLGLNHTTSANAVMFATVTQAVAKRTLTALDEQDVCAVYPGTAGGQGTTCNVGTDCNGGRVCEGPMSGGMKICTADCTGNGACPSGFTCQMSTAGSACLPQIGTTDQCKFCQTGGGCTSGLCLRFDTGVTFCSLNCTDSAQCGPNFTCQMPEGFCVPNSMTCINQCSSATDCASGYTCTGGTCTPRGATGDPCGVSLICQGCNVCTRESATGDAAFCRGCCGSSGAGTCMGCPNAACATGAVCAALTQGNSSVCIPGSAQPTTCQACNAQTTCAEGLNCIAGRCRSECNPAAPGSCQACFATGGTGACACQDEIAGAGEPCGFIGQTLSACGPGTSCVGSSNAVCRSRCDVMVPASCPTGQTCQMLSGIGVCVPGSEGSVCSPCTNANQCNGNLTCYLGRCYEPCNVNLTNTCSTCVQSQPSGVGICGCPDQVSPADGPCGTMPEVHSCQTGTKCIEGSCRARCDPGLPTCAVATTCRDIGNGIFYCQDELTSGGGGGSGGSGGSGGGSRGGGGGSTPTGGGTGGGSMDLGCGCGSSGGPLGGLIFGLAALLRRRRA